MSIVGWQGVSGYEVGMFIKLMKALGLKSATAVALETTASRDQKLPPSVGLVLNAMSKHEVALGDVAKLRAPAVWGDARPPNLVAARKEIGRQAPGVWGERAVDQASEWLEIQERGPGAEQFLKTVADRNLHLYPRAIAQLHLGEFSWDRADVALLVERDGALATYVGPVHVAGGGSAKAVVFHERGVGIEINLNSVRGVASEVAPGLGKDWGPESV